MTKADIIAVLAKDPSIPSKAAATAAVDTLVSLISTSLAAGTPFRLPGVGVLEVVETEARTARNPATGEAVEVPARRRVKFRTSDVLKAHVNRSAA